MSAYMKSGRIGSLVDLVSIGTSSSPVLAAAGLNPGRREMSSSYVLIDCGLLMAILLGLLYTESEICLSY